MLNLFLLSFVPMLCIINLCASDFDITLASYNFHIAAQCVLPFPCPIPAALAAFAALALAFFLFLLLFVLLSVSSVSFSPSKFKLSGTIPEASAQVEIGEGGGVITGVGSLQ